MSSNRAHGASDLLLGWIKMWGPLVALMLAAICLRTLKLDLFYSRDELVIWRWGNEFFTALWQGSFANAVFESVYPGVTLFWLQALYGVLKLGFLALFHGQPPLLATIVDAPDSLAYLAEQRMVVGLATAAQIGAIYGLAAKVYNRRVAWLSAFLIALDPFVLAESRVFRCEAFAGGFMILTVLAWLGYSKERKWRYLALSGILGGWAVLTKTSAGLVAPVIGLLLLLDWLLGRDGSWLERLKLMVWRGIQWGGLAVIAFWLSWPMLWFNPAPYLDTIFARGMSHASEGDVWHGDVFFAGHIIPNDPGLLFYPVTLAFRSTPLMWLGLAWALAILGYALKKRVTAKNERLSELATSAGVWVVYAGVIFVGLSFVLSKVDRYLLPIFPGLDILSALGAVWVWDWSSQTSRNPRWASWLAKGGVLALCIAQLWLTLSTYPYFYSYWNPLVGGGAAAVKNVPVGSGEGLDQAIDLLNRLPDAKQLTLVCGASRPWCGDVFTGTTWSSEVLNSGEWARADYVLFYVAWSQRQTYPQEVVDYLLDRHLVYQVDLGGATYAWLCRVPKMEYYSGGRLEGRGTLFGYNLSSSQLQAGDVLTATLYWRNESQRPGDAFFVKVVDSAGYPWVSTLPQPRPGFEAAARTPDTIVESEAALRLPPGMPPGQYVLKMGFVTGEDQALVGDFKLPENGDDVQVTLPGAFPAADRVVVPHLLKFTAEDVSVLGYGLAPVAVRAGEKGWLTLFWQAQRDAPQDYVVGIRLLSGEGKEAAYWLGRPVYSGYPMPKWVRGQVIQDPWELPISKNVPAGDYQLELALYDSATGEKLAHTVLGPWSVTAP
jgi:4-amino-4-deoxy-L-arabinose transferase-like glycosyltransferase